jgi:DNA-directed RNA polymerase subunit RPC12/RpoP
MNFSADEILYIMARIEDMPEPSVPSERSVCSECGAETWLDVETERVALTDTSRRGLRLVYLCTECGPELTIQDALDNLRLYLDEL